MAPVGDLRSRTARPRWPVVAWPCSAVAHRYDPTLAQGANMAIGCGAGTVPVSWCGSTCGRCRRYAHLRWARLPAQVQARSRRNGRVFHLDGPMRVATDASRWRCWARAAHGHALALRRALRRASRRLASQIGASFRSRGTTRRRAYDAGSSRHRYNCALEADDALHPS